MITQFNGTQVLVAVVLELIKATTTTPLAFRYVDHFTSTYPTIVWPSYLTVTGSKWDIPSISFPRK